MNSSRSMTSLSSHYQNKTIQSSLLEWLNSFDIDSSPAHFDLLYTGVPLFEVLNKVDTIYWPKSKLQKGPSQKASV